jgi:hypothetical protein
MALSTGTYPHGRKAATPVSRRKAMASARRWRQEEEGVSMQGALEFFQQMNLY